MPTWVKRSLSAFGFAVFLAVQVFGLWHGKPRLAYRVGTSIYLSLIGLLGLAVDRGLAKK